MTQVGRLQDKVAIITGAGQGIGLAYAERFLAEGAKVVVAEINEDRAETAMKQLDGQGEVIFVKTDISDEQSTQDCAAATLAHFGQLDILVNNAALYYDIDNERNDFEYLQTVFKVNLHGAWLMARACAPPMVEQRWGRIINQSSGAAYMYNLAPMGDFHEVAGVHLQPDQVGRRRTHQVPREPARSVQRDGQLHRARRDDDRGHEEDRARGVHRDDPDDERDEADARARGPRRHRGVLRLRRRQAVTGQVLCVDGGSCMPA